MEILSFAKLSKLPNYQGKISLKGYNTLVKAYHGLLNVVADNQLQCNIHRYGGLHNKTRDEAAHVCHTNACIVGAIALLYPLRVKYFSDLTLQPRYSYRMFQKDRLPLIFAEDRFINYPRGTIWEFLFSTKWYPFQNTFYKGRERILILLSGNYDSNWMYTKSNNIILNTY